jgi:chemotaxis protein methyltransferase CheR
MNYKLTDIELSRVRELLTSLTGLDFPSEKRDMLTRSLALAATEFGFKEMTGFINWLTTHSLSENQIQTLASFLTIPETYFWREPHVFEALTDVIIPKLASSKLSGEKSIRIWSAGCSSGEEAYSLAIALHRTLKNIEEWNISILATDINPNVISKAREGIYGPWSFRNTPEWLKRRYFNKISDKKYEIIPEIKKLVTFECRTLLEKPAKKNEGTMDIIFCRNVLMYLSEEWIRKISDGFLSSLTENGWFAVSSCELSATLFPKFTPVNFPGAVLYRKENEESSSSADPHLTGFDSNFSYNNISSLNFDDEEIKRSFIENSGIDSIAKDLFGKTDTVTDSQIKSDEINEINSLQTREADALTESENSVRLLAGKGNLKDALDICNDLIATYRLEPKLYLLRSSILQEMDNNSEAVSSLRQAIFLNPDYIMGHFTLANLLIRQGNYGSAKRYFNNVIELTGRLKNDSILTESEGLSIRYIREITFSTMQIKQIL